MNRIKNVLLAMGASLGTLSFLLAFSFAAQPVGAQSIADNVCRGILSTETGTFKKDATAASCAQSGDQTLSSVMQRVINIFSVVVGTVSVIMIIIGGFRYIISGGSSDSVTAAKNTILYAIVGLVIVIFAQVIIRFVITNVSPS